MGTGTWRWRVTTSGSSCGSTRGGKGQRDDAHGAPRPGGRPGGPALRPEADAQQVAGVPGGWWEVSNFRQRGRPRIDSWLEGESRTSCRSSRRMGSSEHNRLRGERRSDHGWKGSQEEVVLKIRSRSPSAWCYHAGLQYVTTGAYLL